MYSTPPFENDGFNEKSIFESHGVAISQATQNLISLNSNYKRSLL